jgi:hypothetical protein
MSVGKVISADAVVAECDGGSGGESVSLLTVVGAAREHTVEISWTGIVSVLLSHVDMRGSRLFVIDGSQSTFWWRVRTRRIRC